MLVIFRLTKVYFELWCRRRLLRVPWTARRSNQSILKEISPEYSLEGLMLTLKLQYFGHLVWRADSFEKTLMLGNIEGGGRRERQRIRWLDGITDSIDMSLGLIFISIWLILVYEPKCIHSNHIDIDIIYCININVLIMGCFFF